MNVSNYLNISSMAGYFSSFSRHLNSSIAPWSRIILATSATALVGLAAYHWSKTQSDANPHEAVAFAKIKERVANTYGYVFGGFALTALSVAAFHISGVSAKILQNYQFAAPVAFLTSIGALFATLYIRKEDHTIRHVAWSIFNISMGAMLAPLAYLNKAALAQAAIITLGIGGGLSLAAYLAPNRSFIKWESPLITVLTTLTFSSLIACFFPKSAFAYGIDRVSLYGGLLLFSAFFMISTQKLFRDAEIQNDQEFDPIRSSIDIYLDGMNIFVRILRMLIEKDEQKA